jgi:hypothetical protein
MLMHLRSRLVRSPFHTNVAAAAPQRAGLAASAAHQLRGMQIRANTQGMRRVATQAHLQPLERLHVPRLARLAALALQTS